MEIPARFICTGDIATARTFIGTGRTCLAKFKEFLAFRKLPSGTSRPFYGPGGVKITCRAIYGTYEVHIHYPSEGGGGGEAIECLCLPHFSIAKIEAVYPEEPTTSELRYGRYTYDISICNEHVYLFFEGAYDANFGRYYVGQLVLATIGKEMTAWDSPLDCDRFCLVQKPRFTVLSICALHVAGRMVEWENAAAD